MRFVNLSFVTVISKFPLIQFPLKAYSRDNVIIVKV